MKLLCDEGIERQVVERLRSEGHDVLYVAEMRPGISDDVVLEAANTAEATLLTNDKDFGELVFRQQFVSRGVVLLRLGGLTPPEKSATVAAVVREHGEALRGSFSVVSPGKVRIRRRPPER